ncbi:MAG: MBL fold metallo-hydrolase [Leptothrix sp. (in: Bacteria)]|nr:MBL fold metallo-hydrolase [Leptothrix sp. (in: b-proteobacteria)]
MPTPLPRTLTPCRRTLRFDLLTALILLTLAALLNGCAQPPRYANSDGAQLDKPLREVLRWYWSRDRSQADRPVQLPVRREPRATEPAAPGELSATWVGHSTVLLRLDGVNVITDPQFSRRASPLRFAGPERRTPLPFEIGALPHIHLVLISHNHYDHLDEASVLALQAQPGGPPIFVVPQGLDAWFHDLGIRDNVHVIAWWARQALAGVGVSAVPARHWSGRGLFDRGVTHWTGWVVQRGGYSVYFAGDTGYGDGSDFRRIGQRFPALDLALIPVGAYEPRWFMREQHTDPAEAVQLFRDLGARQALGIHWGTFALADEALDAPIAALAAARRSQGVAEADFRLLEHGQTWVLHAPPHPAQ